VHVPTNLIHLGVTRGLDPRVHLLAKKMDGRVKPGNDSGCCINLIGTLSSERSLNP
jgi:hypothetical protein